MNIRLPLTWKTIAPIGLVLVGIAVLATSCAGVSGGGGTPPIETGTNGTLLNTITVTGSGDSTGTPDVADIQLGIDITDAQVGTAIQKANDAMNAITTAVKAKGVADKDLQTTNFNVYPQDVTDSNGQPTGQRTYHVQNFLDVKVRDISKVGDVIDAGLSAGATNISNLSFSVDDPSKLEADARSKALKDAQDRAQQLAAGVGVKLGKPVLVSETLATPQVFQGPVFAAAVVPAGKGAGAPPISTGQQTVTVTVDVTYAISQ